MINGELTTAAAAAENAMYVATAVVGSDSNLNCVRLICTASLLVWLIFLMTERRLSNMINGKLTMPATVADNAMYVAAIANMIWTVRVVVVCVVCLDKIAHIYNSSHHNRAMVVGTIIIHYVCRHVPVSEIVRDNSVYRAGEHLNVISSIINLICTRARWRSLSKNATIES